MLCTNSGQIFTGLFLFLYRISPFFETEQTTTSGSMTLVLKNLQNIVRLKVCQIEKDINILRRLMEIDKFDVSVLFVTDDYIQKLNQSYRYVEGATDVLAFPALEVN